MILRSLECRFLTIALCDAAEPWQLGSQDAATPMMQGIIDLHHDIFFFLILILVFVSRMLVRALWHFNEQTNPIPQRIVHGTTIEIIRTIFPSVILLFIAIPSFALLYSMDGVLVDPAITIKAIGHQWYRSAPLNEAVAYNFGPKGRPRYLSEWGIPVGNNHGSSCGTTGPREDNLLFLLLLLRFGDGGPTVGKSTHKHLTEGDQRFYSSTEEPFLREARDVVNGGSYTIPEDDPELGQSRLLEVDNRVVVPAKTHLRMIVTPADVPHSWAVPSSGVKCDAVPGRSNLTSISVQREGVYYGQCSEICGTNHAFTPIVVEAVTLKDYADWVSNQLILQTN
uniref:Cytochrome c oxidase subunit 2 n=1 Tax=Oryza punctata TaxID=4537 RepID=A0A0E0JWW3_ORYPU